MHICVPCVWGKLSCWFSLNVSGLCSKWLWLLPLKALQAHPWQWVKALLSIECWLLSNFHLHCGTQFLLLEESKAHLDSEDPEIFPFQFLPLWHISFIAFCQSLHVQSLSVKQREHYLILYKCQGEKYPNVWHMFCLQLWWSYEHLYNFRGNVDHDRSAGTVQKGLH